MAIYSIAEISKQLAERAEAVCMKLLPTGKRNKDAWEAGDISGSEGNSCKVTLTGAYAGEWRDWANDSQKGDLVDLWEQVQSVSRIEALKQIKDYLGIVDAFTADSAKKTYHPPKPRDTHLEASPNGKVMLYLTEKRKLEPAIINRFMVHADKRGYIVYPRYSPAGEILNNQYIGLTRDEKGKKKVHQETGCAPCLFGWQGLSDAAFTSRTVLICEGEIDCMTWTQYGIDALSIPNGSGTTWIEYEWPNLEAFSTIYLSLDMDGKSEENLRKCVQRLGAHRCRIVHLPKKDANECLLAGYSADEAQDWIRNAQYPEFKGLANADAFRQAVLDGFYPPPGKENLGWKPPVLQRSDGGIEFLPGDLSVWTGVSGNGKSTFLGWLMLQAILGGKRVCIASMEMKPEKIIQRMVTAIMKVVLPTQDEINAIVDMLQARLVFVDRMGYVEAPELLEIMRFAYARYDVTHFVIDSLMRVAGLEEDFPAQGEFLNKLQEFSKGTDSHVHLVCHPRKIADGATPGKMDVKGSSLIPNNADNIISVRRNNEKLAIEKTRPLTPEERNGMWDTMISCEKQRESGWEGSLALAFCSKTFRFDHFYQTKTL